MPFQIQNFQTNRANGSLYRATVLKDGAVGYWRLGEDEGYAQAILSDGAIDYWPLNGNANDVGSGAHNGSAGAGVTFGVTGPLSNGTTAAAFNGAAGAVITVASGPNFTTGSFSYEIWIQDIVNTGSFQFPISKGGQSAATTGYDLEINTTGNITADISDGTVIKTAGFATGGFSFWATPRLVTVVVDRTANTLALYIDGIVRGTPTNLGTFGSVSNASTFSISNGSSRINGTLSNVAVYDYALSAQQIANHYNLRLSGINTVAAMTVADSSGNNQTGTVSKGVTFRQPNFLADGDGAGLFDGVAGMISIADSVPLSLTTAGSVELWAFTLTTPGGSGAGMVNKQIGGSAATNPVYGIIQNNARQYTFQRVTPPDSLASVASAATSLNVWNHIVGTYDGSNLRIYINGVEQTVGVGGTSPVAATGNIDDTTGNLTIGPQKVVTGRFFNGLIDEVAVYPTALSAQQVAEHYNIGVNSEYFNTFKPWAY